MVAPSVKYPEYIVLFQGDNTGPHQDATFLNCVRDHCRGKGWHWEPQAAQMPHMNALDLSVFPCMSCLGVISTRAESVVGFMCWLKIKSGKLLMMCGILTLSLTRGPFGGLFKKIIK